MSDWSAFYTVVATAAATLLGLLVVAVSIAEPSALNDNHSPIRTLAEQSFQNYLLVLVLSCCALFPAMGLATLGKVILFVTASRAVWALIRLWAIVSFAKGWRAMLRGLRRQFASLVGLACLLVASVRMAQGSMDAFHLLAAGTLVLLASSAVASWELLLQLVKGRSGEANTAK